MGKLYFKYGAMGSSKTANALMVKFNYEEKGKKVWLIKPATDNRDGYATVKSRIGLQAEAEVILASDSIREKFPKDIDVIICDEAQFLTEAQVDELRLIIYDYHISVLCFGLITDFMNHLFPGSKRLLELAESITEIKSICRCGAKATVNARFDDEGNVTCQGDQVCIGGNDRYEGMCWDCWHKAVLEQEAKRLHSK